MYRDRYHLEDESSNYCKKKLKTKKPASRRIEKDDWIIEDHMLSALKQQGLRLGRVIEAQKGHMFIAEESEEVALDTGNIWFCSIAKRHFQRIQKERNFVVTGDLILFEADPSLLFDEENEPVHSDLPRGIIQHTLRRRNKIARTDPLKPQREHIMLANIDLIAIVASVLNPQVRWGLIDRFLVQAELENISTIILLNKHELLTRTHLASAEFLQKYEYMRNSYQSLGYEIIELSALKRKDYSCQIQYLRKLFKNKFVGFVGHSGVGKSSIINLLKPEFQQSVDDNPDIFYKGRHTTTFNSLLQLGIGGYAIDTPGIRSFHIIPANAAVLTECFPEFRNKSCRYNTCMHEKEAEKDCGIKSALAQGLIIPQRYQSYLNILRGTSTREGCLS